MTTDAVASHTHSYPSGPTLEELIVKIESAGFRVANLFQFEDGEGKHWRCNLCMPEHRYEFADATDAFTAMKEALAQALGERKAKSVALNKQNTLTLEDLGL